jgi:RNA polymerase sigma-70 factor, ECF subfamily
MPMRSDWREQADAGNVERALVQRMIAGDQAAFAAFAQDYIPAVYRFAQRRLGDRELTREIVQATVCKVIANLRSFRGEAGLITWICACCRNEIAAHYRRQGRNREVEMTDGDMETSAPGPEQSLLGKERARRVHAALDALPPRYSQALEWKYVDRLSVEEIAGRLEVGPKAAESLLTRARQSFRNAFGQG